jgi:hypothetical protein
LRVDSDHDVDLEIVACVLFVPVFGAVVPIEATETEASGIDREIGFDGTQRQAAGSDQVLDSSRDFGRFDDIENTVVAGRVARPNRSHKWEFANGGFVNSSPSIGPGGIIYIGSSDENLYALIDGQGMVSKKWSFATAGTVGDSAIGSDGTIYVGSADHNLYAVNPDGSQKCKFMTGGTVGIFKSMSVLPPHSRGSQSGRAWANTCVDSYSLLSNRASHRFRAMAAQERDIQMRADLR